MLVDSVEGRDDRLLVKVGLASGLAIVGGNSAMGEFEGIANEVEEE